MKANRTEQKETTFTQSLDNPREMFRNNRRFAEVIMAALERVCMEDGDRGSQDITETETERADSGTNPMDMMFAMMAETAASMKADGSSQPAKEGWNPESPVEPLKEKRERKRELPSDGDECEDESENGSENISGFVQVLGEKVMPDGNGDEDESEDDNNGEDDNDSQSEENTTENNCNGSSDNDNDSNDNNGESEQEDADADTDVDSDSDSDENGQDDESDDSNSNSNDDEDNSDDDDDGKGDGVEETELREISQQPSRSKGYMSKPFFSEREAEEIVSDTRKCLSSFDRLFMNRVWNCCKAFIQEGVDEDGYEIDRDDPEGYWCYDDEFERSVTYPAYEEAVEIVRQGYWMDESGNAHECTIDSLPTPDDGIGFMVCFEKRDTGSDVLRVFSKTRFRNVWGEDALHHRGGRTRADRKRAADENLQALERIMELGDDDERFGELTRMELTVYNFAAAYLCGEDEKLAVQEPGAFINRQELQRFVERNRHHGIKVDELKSVMRDGSVDENGAVNLRATMFDAQRIAAWNEAERKRVEEEKQRKAEEEAKAKAETERTEEEPQFDTRRRRTGPRRDSNGRLIPQTARK